MKKIKVVVIMGGLSSEYEVSIMSGKEIAKNLDKNKYLVYPIVIDKKGGGLEKIAKIKPDVAFLALHGKFGEDGKIQGYLESLGIKHTGSGILASAIGMNKIIFRKIVEKNNILSPKYIVVDKKNSSAKPPFKPPYFVKPFDGGSSVGVSLAPNLKELPKAIAIALKYSDMALIEKYIKGTEVSCGVLGNENPKALPVIEIRPNKNIFFDYKSKYSKKGANEIAPARISEELTKRIQKLSLSVYKIIGCSGYARVDFMLENGNKPVVLEINTLPGMTANSLLPKEARAAGISYSELLDMIISFAVVK